MINKRKKSWIAGAFFLFWTSFSVAYNGGGMRPLNEDQMRSVTGQGLIVSDKISGTTLANPNAYSSPFEFYRIGLDGELQLNLNVSKLQLGCGGINDHLSGHAGCDIDIDYLSLMGRNGTDIGDPGSPFKLDRPYIEFAVKNDNSTTLREIAGIKIGAQSADGAISAGRRYYSNNAVNQENTAFATTCNTGSVTGAGVVGCHSGINSVSGFLGSELSLTMDIEARLLSIFTIRATGCTGRTSIGHDDCGNNLNDALFVDLAGTRMQTLGLQAAELKTNNLEFLGGSCSFFNPLACAAQAVMDTVFASLNTDLRNVHKLTFEDTSDFFLSFQREPIAYPRYSKMTPTEELPSGAFDICATGNATPRCSSGYAVPANTGWWLNAPSVKLLDVYNPNADLGNRGIDEAIALLGAPGLLLEHPEFDLAPKQNCYGSTMFC
jgi:hypothetical protein